MTRTTTLRPAAPLVAVATALLLAACGGSNSSDDSTNTSASTSASGGGQTVAVKSVSGVGDVLVDANGQVLYTNDMDSAKKVACTGECAAIWVPLTLPSGTTSPTGPSDVASELGTVAGANGEMQVTYDGKPLYTFVQDGPGEATGDGVTDSFAGTSFTWSVASTSESSGGGAAEQTTTSSPSSSGGGGYGY